MATIALIVELMIVGIQSFVWILLVLFLAAGQSPLEYLISLKIPEILLGLIGFGLCYTAGGDS